MFIQHHEIWEAFFIRSNALEHVRVIIYPAAPYYRWLLHTPKMSAFLGGMNINSLVCSLNFLEMQRNGNYVPSPPYT